MSKPIIRKIKPFPATTQQLLKFDVVGNGNQVVFNELEIRKNSTNEIVYQKKIQEFRYQHLIGEGSNLVGLSTSDYITYTIPSELNLSESYQIYKDQNIITTGYTVDEINKTVTFDQSLKEDITDILSHVINYKTFKFINKAEQTLSFTVLIDGVKTSLPFSVNYEEQTITFDENLLENIRETLSYNSTKKCFTYTNNLAEDINEKIFINNISISSGYEIDYDLKEIYFFQTASKEKATANSNFTSYTVSNQILLDSEVEVYIDNELVTQGYSVDYVNKKINFFFPPYPLNKDSKVEVTYKSVFVPTDTIEMEYGYFDKVITANYTKLIPQVSISQSYLENGQQYYAIIRIYDLNDALIGTSDPEFFYCFSTPSLTIDQIVNSDTNSQTITFTGTYSQNEGEIVQSYIYSLYDSNQILISMSEEIFNNDLTYEFTSLENNKTYYIELKTITINELEHSTGLLSFTPKYVAPRFASAIELENNFNEASVNVECNVIRIIGTPKNEPVDYLADKQINLRTNEVIFDKGFSLENDFTIQLYTKDIIDEQWFFELKSKSGVSLRLRKEGTNISLYKLSKESLVLQYLSNDLQKELNSEILFISIKQINGYYDLYTDVLEVS